MLTLTDGNVAQIGDITIISVISMTCWRRECPLPAIPTNSEIVRKPVQGRANSNLIAWTVPVSSGYIRLSFVLFVRQGIGGHFAQSE
jgi:hypothetical protein